MKKIFSGLFLMVFLSCSVQHKTLVLQGSYTGVEKAEEAPKIAKLIAPYKTKIDAEMNLVIGVSAVAMPKVKDTPESLLGNFAADAVMWFARKIDSTVNVAVLNNGGLRTSLPQGEITVRNIFELMPFDNELVLITISGEVMETLLDYIATTGGMPVSGLKMNIISREKKRVWTEVFIGGKSFDLSVEENSSHYRIATSDYLINGGDNMSFWTQGIERVNTGKKIRDIFLDYVQWLTTAGKEINPVLEGRVKLTEGYY